MQHIFKYGKLLKEGWHIDFKKISIYSYMLTCDKCTMCFYCLSWYVCKIKCFFSILYLLSANFLLKMKDVYTLIFLANCTYHMKNNFWILNVNYKFSLRFSVVVKYFYPEPRENKKKTPFKYMEPLNQTHYHFSIFK